MFLKNLTLKGFKSFADTTKIELTSGITVVVGPNGSGKSNVVDAIAWVLGAQAPKAVRSGKMDDVIFAGTAKRAALGRAEVSLTIDNSDGALPIDFTEVTLTRVLFRTGDSEYAINGVPCRLLDIQDLLSDSGVGRQQHVIVSQGQIDAVLNAKPEERRFIIEEAAGILKYRRRKEKAERRLLGTEANLLRLQDLLREIRRQLRPLERQAEAARRHEEVSASLHEIRGFLAGRELATVQAGLVRSNDELSKLSQIQNQLQTRLASLDARVMAEESRLDTFGAHDLSDDLVVLETLAARAKAIRSVIEERQRNTERDLATPTSSVRLDNLLAQNQTIQTELQSARAALDDLVLSEAALVEDEAQLSADRRSASSRWPQHDLPVDARVGEVRGELGALRGSSKHNAAEILRIDEELTRLQSQLHFLTAEKAVFEGKVSGARTQEAVLAKQHHETQDQLQALGQQLTEAEEHWQELRANATRWSARAEALGLALDEARLRAGSQALHQVDGVIGTLLDVLIIDAGWEAACEAALGDVLSSVVVEGVAPGRASLSVLAQSRNSVTVLPLGLFHKEGHASKGINGLDGLVESGRFEPVLRYVRSRSEGVQSLLNHLLANAYVVEGEWREALDLALERPENIFVTKSGDRFSPAGWRIGAGGAGATGAAYEEALTEAETARAKTDDAAKVHQTIRSQHERAQVYQQETATTLNRLRADLTSFQRSVDEHQAKLENTTQQLQSAETRRDERQARHQQELARLHELEAWLPSLEADEEARRREVHLRAEERAVFDERARQLAMERRSLELKRVEQLQRVENLQNRANDLAVRIDDEGVAAERASLLRQDAQKRLNVLKGELEVVVEQQNRLKVRLDALTRKRQERSDEVRHVFANLEALRSERTTAEGQLQEIRESANREALAVSQLQMRLETLVGSIRSELDIEPTMALEKERPEIPDGISPQEWRRSLEREVRLMGPINPLALSEYEALLERHEFLSAQLDDVRATRRDLAKIIRAVDAEIVEVFSAAYKDVADNFVELFTTLFPGGKGGLHLSDDLDLLASGVEVEARPSGKNVAKLSLLSGGERSLTALAFLFAVFRSRPSPFYVMDEVEAALDDVNLHRFLQLVQEFRADAQLLIVSHQKRTMEIADYLYGVTMQPGGSSKVVSERVTSVS